LNFLYLSRLIESTPSTENVEAHLINETNRKKKIINKNCFNTVPFFVLLVPEAIETTGKATHSPKDTTGRYGFDKMPILLSR